MLRHVLIYVIYSLNSYRTQLQFEPHIVFKLRKIGLNIFAQKKKKKTLIPIKAGLYKCSQAALLFNSIRMNDAAACNHAVNRNYNHRQDDGLHKNRGVRL